VIASVVVVGLYQSYNRDQTEAALRKQVEGVASYYQGAFFGTFGKARKPPPGKITVPVFNRVSDAKLYYSGPKLFPVPGARNLKTVVPDLNPGSLSRASRPVYTFMPPGASTTYIGVGAPIMSGAQPIGVVVLAKPLADVNNAWKNVIGLVAAGVAVGLIVAIILATYVARRITQPLRVLGSAADKVARGDLDVNVIGKRTSDDELGQLATRFQGMVDRLREVDELERNFLMRVTHELRTPLTAIAGHVQAVSDGVVDPEDMEDSMVAVNEEVRRLDRLVNDLLDLTRLESHQFRVVSEEVGLAALLEQAAAAFREKARANEIDFQTDIANAPTVITDGDRVLQIVTNLLDNAFRWTPRAGSVRLGCLTSSGIAAVTVSDSGPGIAPADLQSVFHPFYSRRGEGGTGLGLSIARELAGALGGRLAVESELGKGTTFTLALPRRRRRRLR
jgi:signal transduction histidine kinase